MKQYTVIQRGVYWYVDCGVNGAGAWFDYGDRNLAVEYANKLNETH
jgi:hypothetical protein